MIHRVLLMGGAVIPWLLLILTTGACSGSPASTHRPLCWKAALRCHSEPECHYAYDQYLRACAGVIDGRRQRCPSHCVSSLIQLNLTRSGPALEDCDCALDTRCRGAKRAIEPCMPRTRALGCTEARRQCELEPVCSAAMRDYLLHCRKLFGGQRCTDSCRRTIAHMRSIPKAQQLDTCVCDGTERNICEYIKVSMRTLCFDAREGSAFTDSEEDQGDDYSDMEEEEEESPRAESASPVPFQTLLHVLTVTCALTLLT